MAKKPPTGPDGHGGRRKSPNKRPSEELISALSREVSWRHDAREAKAREGRPLRKLGHIRVRQLERLIWFRFPDTKTLPDCEASRDFVRLAVGHCAHMQDGHRRALNFISLYASWFPTEELESYWLAVEPSPPYISAEEAGERIQLLYAERKLLRGPTMFCIDKSRNEVKALQRLERNQKDRERRHRKRQTVIRKCTSDSGDNFVGERELAVLSRLKTGWNEAPTLIAMMMDEPAFAGIAPVSMRVTVHRCIDRLEKCGLAECANYPAEEKRTKLVRLKNSL